MSERDTSSKGAGSLLAQAQRFIGAFWGYAGRRGAVAVALVAAGALLEGVGLTLLAPILAVVTGAASQGRMQTLMYGVLDRFGAHSQATRLALLLGLFVALMLGRAVVLYGRDTRLGALQLGFLQDRRNRIMRKLGQASWAHVMALSHARISNLMGADIQRLGMAANFMVQGGVALAVLAIQGAIAFAMAPAMAAVALALLLAGALAMAPALRRARDLGSAVSGSQLILMTNTTGFLAGLKSALAQNVQQVFVDEFEQVQHQLGHQQMTFVQRQARGRLLFGVISAVAGALVALASLTVLSVPPAVVVVLIVIFTRMSGPALMIQQSVQQLAHVLPAYDVVAGLEAELDTAAARDRGVGDAVAPPAGPLALEAVSYVHPDGSGLHEASLQMKPGAMIGLVGPSGSGKTTLADIAVGLLEPQSGVVTVCGAALTGPALRGWRNQIAYVSQETFLFHDTIRRNLLWAAPGADEPALWAALELAGAAALVRRRGLDSLVGERGSLLSGGERQRLALARALLRKPRLLVLDEATNAIDVEGEADILDRLAGLADRPTVLIIAHRSESLSRCDETFRLAKGRLV